MLDDEPLTHAGAAVDDAPPEPEQAPEAINDRSSRAIKAVLLALKAGPLFILALMMLFLWVATEGHVFMTFGNIGNVLEQSSGVCIIALGQLLVILTRGIDLSIGSNVSLCCVVVTVVYRDTHSAWLAIGVTLLTGLAVGLTNGLLLVWGRLPHPFIATLATLSICAGLALYIAGGSTVLGSPWIVQQARGRPYHLDPRSGPNRLVPLRHAGRHRLHGHLRGHPAQARVGTLDLRRRWQPRSRGPNRCAHERDVDLGLRHERAVRRDRRHALRRYR